MLCSGKILNEDAYLCQKFQRSVIGNNTTIKNEMVKLADNAMLHSVALRLMQHQFSMLESGIRGQA